MKKLFTAAVLGITLTGCATYEPVPQGYVGPTATVVDSGFSEDGTKAQLFALVAIDDNRVANAFAASAIASHGRGASLTTVFPERSVKAKPMKVTLRGSHATGAPIHAMASQMAGTFFSVEGSVDFSPQENRKYRVKGELKKEKSSVWIEDAETGEPATSVISK
jgi:hypothetical protein